MPSFEIEDSFKNHNIIAGIDEAGRGPLCGPVFASCVILNIDYVPKYVNDSKKLTEKKREEIFQEILNLEKEKKLFFGLGQSSVEEIEKINIRNATKLAMKRSYEDLKLKYNIKPDLVIVDGNFVPDIDTKAEFIIKGDTKSLTIATASIIAKVSRDLLLYELDKESPQYGWKNNKGYGTKQHYEAINKYGICEHHRKSFIHFNEFNIANLFSTSL